MTVVFLVIAIALIFEYINGFHDTANSIATVVGTKVLTPRQAIVLAATTNLLGAFTGIAVAKTISSGLVGAEFVTQGTLVCALFAGIVWNLLTWLFGIPSSSSHALFGGLIGAGLAALGTAGINWSGVTEKVLIPAVAAPIIAGIVLIIGGVLMVEFGSHPRTTEDVAS